jgi:hypothetical protein
MLKESRRRQLDGIVQEMTNNNESEQNIQLVVDDFKKKYASQVQTVPNIAGKSTLEKVGDVAAFVPETFAEVGKGVLKTGVELFKGASSLGEKGLDSTLRALLPKGLESSFAIKDPLAPTAAEELIPEKLTEAQNTAQSAGKFIGEVASFIFC